LIFFKKNHFSGSAQGAAARAFQSAAALAGKPWGREGLDGGVAGEEEGAYTSSGSESSESQGYEVAEQSRGGVGEGARLIRAARERKRGKGVLRDKLSARAPARRESGERESGSRRQRSGTAGNRPALSYCRFKSSQLPL
jgi:hypothetical protein